jgi:hypothetical protein
MPSVTFTETDGTLVISGDQFANSIVVTDDGSANAGNVVVEADGETYTSLGAVTTIRVVSRSGADDVQYSLTGDLTSERTVRVYLGNQHDSFTANLIGDLLEGADLTICANGGNGHDSLAFTGVDANVGLGASLLVKLLGGNGVDSLAVDYAGLLNGTASFVANGGNGKDSVAGHIVLHSWELPETGESQASSGELTAIFRGGNGVDAMALSVEGAESLSVFDARVNGGRGKDTFETSDNVTVVDAPKGKK